MLSRRFCIAARTLVSAIRALKITVMMSSSTTILPTLRLTDSQARFIRDMSGPSGELGEQGFGLGTQHRHRGDQHSDADQGQ